MKNLLVVNQQKTMSSIELAGLLNFDKKEVHRKLKTMFGDEKVSGEFSPTLRPNGQVLEYNIPELESKMFVAKWDITYLEKITKFWITNSTVGIPQTFTEALKLAYDQSLQIEEQQKTISIKNNLIIASNEASIKAGEILVREFVKSQDLIMFGEKKFYTWMREQKIIQANSREPYQYFVDRGYFTYKPTEGQHGGKFRYTLRVTPRGKVWLSARFLTWQDREDIVIGDK